jgi:hypothetical protein
MTPPGPVRMLSRSPRVGTPLQSLSGHEQDTARIVATNDRTGPSVSFDLRYNCVLHLTPGSTV